MPEKGKPSKQEWEQMTEAERAEWEDAFSKGILITDPLPEKQQQTGKDQQPGA